MNIFSKEETRKISLIGNLLGDHLKTFCEHFFLFFFFFQVCPSYPASVVVPAKMSDDTLKASAQFRQSGRFPVLSYYHKRNGVRIYISLPQWEPDLALPRGTHSLFHRL